MFKRRYFEEEAVEPTAEAAPAAEETTADPATALIDALTAMGLSAEQADAVLAMAEDLIAAGGGEEAPAEEAPAEATEVEASRHRRARARLSRGRRSRLSRGRRSRFSKSRRTTEGRRPRRQALSQEQKVIARQRRQIALMRNELRAKGQKPAAQKLSRNPLKGRNVTQSQRPIQGRSVKERVFNYVKGLI